jgi:hypothetical protein
MGNDITIAGDWAKPVDTLIKKIAHTTGVLYEPTRIKRKAKAEAEANLIKVKNEIEINDIQQRALQRLLTEETKKQENIEDITEKSFENINESAKPEDIDEDWLSNFFDKCKNISNEEMQTHWSKLLSDEANNPGSISKKTIETFYMMDKKDALLYTKLLTYGWMFGNSVTIMIDDIQNNIYSKNGIDFSSLSHLEDMGLIKFNTLSGFKRMGFPKHIGILYYGNLVQIEFNKETDNDIEIGKVLLTNVGLELSKIVNAQMDNEYFEYMKDKLSKKVKLI